MNADDFFYLGKVIRTKGFKGELKIFMDVDEPAKYSGLDGIFILIKRDLIPYFIERIKLEDNKATIKLQDIDSEQDAAIFVNREIYLPLENLPKLEGNKFYFHEIIGFEIIDLEHGKLGKIEEVLDYPANPLFRVIHEGKEILIPISDEVIRKVDRENNVIEVSTPEGLIDIYL